MGCDIHNFLERKNANGVWEWVKTVPAYHCGWCDGKGRWENAKGMGDCYNCGGAGKCTKVWRGRNYNVFAILADVRNGRGFAGVETSKGFKVIAEPRGLPKDMSPELMAAMCVESPVGLDGQPVMREYDDKLMEEHGWLGEHSFSHLTLEEIVNFDWKQKTTLYGVLPWSNYKTWLADGGDKSPEIYSGGVWGQNILTIKHDDVAKMLQSGEISEEGVSSDGDSVNVRVSWTETYREACSDEFFTFIEALSTLDKPENLRLVFGFDN